MTILLITPVLDASKEKQSTDNIENKLIEATENLDIKAGTIYVQITGYLIRNILVNLRYLCVNGNSIDISLRLIEFY